MKVGKAKKGEGHENNKISPLHLVLLEEPEAHLHIQVQQVFIKKAYSVLRNHGFLKENLDFSTQLIISSHSSHIAREISFSDLRYFKRLLANTECTVPTSKVINLSNIFGKGIKTDKFVTRYLRTTHCDLFFADALIFVEGSTENMLIPHFIYNRYPKLNQRYITILGINGRHSDRLRPLIETLCLPTLLITDIDSSSPEGHRKSTCPKRNLNLISSNPSITKWITGEEKLDTLLDLPSEKKEKKENGMYKYSIRITYQMPVKVDFKDEKEVEAISSTFEDCLIYTNLDIFEKTKGIGLISKVQKLIERSITFDEFHLKLYEMLRNNCSLKAGFALDLIYSIEPEKLKVPLYISEGLIWLQEQIEPCD